MLYEIDSFGFCPGFVRNGWTLMSEKDLRLDDSFREKLEEVKYDLWKRNNILHLIREYDSMKNGGDFERFCKNKYEDR